MALVGFYYPRLSCRRLLATWWAVTRASSSRSSKWDQPPPPPSTLGGSGERPKCVVLHCTPPRASRDVRQLEEVGCQSVGWGGVGVSMRVQMD